MSSSHTRVIELRFYLCVNEFHKKYKIFHTLGKIFEVSVPDPSQIWPGSCKDSLFFPEETTDSWKKRVAVKFKDPARIQNKIFNDPEKFTIAF